MYHYNDQEFPIREIDMALLTVHYNLSNTTTMGQGKAALVQYRGDLFRKVNLSEWCGLIGKWPQ